MVLPDSEEVLAWLKAAWSQCTYRCVVLPDFWMGFLQAITEGLNAPTGAWCSLTGHDRLQ